MQKYSSSIVVTADAALQALAAAVDNAKAINVLRAAVQKSATVAAA